ncbi:MAG: MarR family transcriptional regulator [Steroidobacteraceae bacterium]|jgi:DNA-binding MarR family transcriptional regulator|nr:MarR family transcriptional regulator [Steroidobacteraceae bacterium]
MDDRSRTFGYLILDVARLTSARFEARVREFGLTRAQWALMAALYRAEGCNQAQLAEVLDVTPISLGRLVDRMERAGWIERRPLDGDRRAYRLFLTERAHAIRGRVRALSDATEREALEALTPDERRRLLGSLDRVRATLLAARG